MLNTKKKSLHAFSLAFLLVGLPILFALREYSPVQKIIFTYGILAFMLISLINYSNLFQLKFYNDKPFIINFLFVTIFILFSVNFLLSGNISQNFSVGIYIFIILFIYLGLLSRRTSDFEKFPKYLLIVSSLSTIVTLITTPLDIVYWIPYGGRLFVGDTENPNLTSFVALMNILSIIFHFRYSQHVIPVYMKFIYFLVGLSSIYLYFLSFSKSALIGFLLALIVIIPLKSYFNRTAIKILGFIVLLQIFIAIFIPNTIEQATSKVSILMNAFSSYFFGEYTNLAADSAAIRHENLTKMFDLLPTIDLLYGKGIFATRADLPALQVFTDLGILVGILNLFLMLLIPFYILFRQYYILKTYKNDPLYKLYLISAVVSLFYLPNLFFHGTPYELSIWLPILILYKFLPWNKKANNA